MQRLNAFLHLLFIAAIASLLAACGGGGGGGSAAAAPATPAPSANQAITAQGAASAGEYVTFTINAARTAYTYTIVDSAYGLTGVTRSGTLTANADGTYTPSLDPNARVAFLPSGLVLAAIHETFNGVVRTVGFIGVLNPVTAMSATAGTYNFVEYVCFSSGSCGVSAGAFNMDGNGNWASCPLNNFAPGCANEQMGTLNSLGNGRFQVLKAGLSIGNAIAYTAPNGQKVVILDLNDGTTSGLGRGLLLGSGQKTLSPTDVAARYVSFNTSGTSAIVDVGSNLAYSSTAGAAGTLSLNQPFSGLITVQPSAGGSALAIMAGQGLYGVVQSGTTGPYFEIGISL